MKLNTKKKERARHHKNEAQGDTNTGRKKKNISKISYSSKPS